MTGYTNVDFIVHGTPIITPITDSLIHKSNTKETLAGCTDDDFILHVTPIMTPIRQSLNY
jgi:hypothetical protein